MKLPWVALQIGSDGHVQIVRYKVCLDMEHKNKLLTLNQDSFQKYANCKKIEKSLNGVKKRCMDYQRDKNEVVYAFKGNGVDVAIGC